MDNTYKIPKEFFFRLHHVRPRFKNDVEEVLLYVATSIAEIKTLPKKVFKEELNKILIKFKKNSTFKLKTINNWRTEIAALFAFVLKKDNLSMPSKMAVRLANNQYLDEFFNYFLLTFQYPGGHVKPYSVANQISAGIRFKPCRFILNLLLEGTKLKGKSFSITAEELTQCAFYDLRVTRDGLSPKKVAEIILNNQKNKTSYSHKYELSTGARRYPSRGDLYRYAGDILDYMVMANLLKHKGTGYYYYLSDNSHAINFHLNNDVWFDGYDKFYGANDIDVKEVAKQKENWFQFVNSFENIHEFSPQLNKQEAQSIEKLIQEYYLRIKGGQKVPTKIIGDYGESLILAHEYLRTQDKSNRQHLINKIPTPLGVGYDIQSIEVKKNKRYIEVKTTKSKKAITYNRFKLTPNEWDTAETIGNSYFIYYLVVNEKEKKIFIIQDPVEQYHQGNLKIDSSFLVEFTNKSGKWLKLLEIN